MTHLPILLEQLRGLRQRPVDSGPGAGAPGRRRGRHQRLPCHGGAAVRLVLHDGGAGGDRASDANLLDLVSQCVQQADYLRGRRRRRDARYEDAAIVDRWTHAWEITHNILVVVLSSIICRYFDLPTCIATISR